MAQLPVPKVYGPKPACTGSEKEKLPYIEVKPIPVTGKGL